MNPVIRPSVSLTNVYLYRAPVDFRQSFKEMAMLIEQALGLNPFEGYFYAFEPAQARRIASKLEIHYIPKQGSWLDTAEIELSILSRQCLDRRVPDQATLRKEVCAWGATRNQHHEKMNGGSPPKMPG